jgi:CRISPR system Cascade subunit CasD
MPRFLVFRLYGPLASWGEVAVGEIRSTAIHPTRSALLGLLAAALGLRRDAEDEHAELSRTLRFAVRVESAGVPLSDYHTAQVMAPRRGRVDATRKAQLRGRRVDLETILSRRDYRCDALYTVVAWQEGAPQGPPLWPLDALARALERPVFPLYLGRKSCPPGLPLSPRVLDAPSAAVAFETVDLPLPFPLPVERMRDGGRAHLGIYWEGSPEIAGLEAEESTLRRDDPGSRLRRDYRTRRELFTPVFRRDEDPDGKEDSDVSEPYPPFS